MLDRRALLQVLVLWGWVAGPLAGLAAALQEAEPAPDAAGPAVRFAADDFGFGLEVPPGLALLPDAELRRAVGLPPDAPLNVPREQSADGKAIHQYVWIDPRDKDHVLRLQLQDSLLPFGRPDEFSDFLRTQLAPLGPVEVREQKTVEPPVYRRHAFTADVLRTLPDGGTLRMLCVYFPMAKERFGVCYLQSRTERWADLRKGFQAAMASVTFPMDPSNPILARQDKGVHGPRPPGEGPPAAAPQPGGAGRGPAAPGGAGRTAPAAPASNQTWASLEVTGSLVLALLLLLSLVAGGRRP